MKVIDAALIANIQAANGDALNDALYVIRQRCVGVDKIACIVCNRPGDKDTTLYTFWFKGHNGKHEVRYTYITDVF